MTERFPEDHPIEALRNRIRPTRRLMKRMLTKRLEWLKEKHAQRSAAPDYNEVMDFTYDELRVIAQAIDFIDEG